MTTLTRQQERALRRHAEGVDRVTTADRAYFDRHPDRRHRLRLMSAAEQAQHEVMNGPLPPQPTGIRWYTVVRKITPDSRLRVFIGAPDFLAGHEQPERHVSRLWGDYASRHPSVHEREAMLLRAARLPGGPLHSSNDRGVA